MLFERDGRWVVGADGSTRSAFPEGVGRCSCGASGACPRTAGPCSPRPRSSGASSPSTSCARWPSVDEDALIAALEEALDAQLVVEAAGIGAGPAYAFTHALVRETLYGGLERAAPAADARARGARDRGGGGARTQRRRARRPLPPRGLGRRPGEGDRVLAAGRQRGARAVRVGRGGGALGRRARGDGARRRPRGRARRGCSSRSPT